MNVRAGEDLHADSKLPIPTILKVLYFVSFLFMLKIDKPHDLLLFHFHVDVLGGKIEAYGGNVPDGKPYQTLTRTAWPNDDEISVDHIPDSWMEDDEVLITPTGLDPNEAEVVEIKTIDKENKIIKLKNKLQYRHICEYQLHFL